MNASKYSRARRGLSAVSALAFLTLPGFCQDIIGNGFAVTASQPTPVAFASYATLSTGERVVFDGLSIDLYDAAGAFLLNLATLPGFVFNSFVEIDPSETFAVVGESSNGTLFNVALNGSGFSTITTLIYNFDAVFEDANNILVSAAPCFTGCGNNIVRVNVGTGAQTIVASVSGNSGPLAMNGNGSLFYATTDFTLPNFTDIISWSPAQLAMGGLTYADAAVFHSGLQAAFSMGIDPVFGNVFLAESIFGGTSRILEFDAATGAQVDVVVESTNFLTTVELLQGNSIGHFHAYQPSDGVFLHYNNNDIVTVRPQRPTASHSQVGQIATFSVQGGEPNGAMLVVFGSVSAFNPNYFTYQLSFDFLFHSVVPVGQLKRTSLLVPLDANGDGNFVYFDPGNLAGNLVFQGLITNSTGKFLGSTEGATN